MKLAVIEWDGKENGRGGKGWGWANERAHGQREDKRIVNSLPRYQHFTKFCHFLTWSLYSRLSDVCVKFGQGKSTIWSLNDVFFLLSEVSKQGVLCFLLATINSGYIRKAWYIPCELKFPKLWKQICFQFLMRCSSCILLTYVMSFIKHNHRFLGQLLGDEISNLRIQEVVITVDDDVGMVYLQRGAIKENAVIVQL